MAYLFWVMLSLGYAADIEVPSLTVEKIQELNQIYPVEVQGDVLLIKGYVGKHMIEGFDGLQSQIKNIKTVELNSLGGNLAYGMELADRIRALNVNTRVSKGNFCASACVVIFSAGMERIAYAGTPFGIHAARISANDAEFKMLCFDDKTGAFDESGGGCFYFLKQKGENIAVKTRRMFEKMESYGVFPSLRETYMALPEDPEWYNHGALTRQPDWLIFAFEAFEYNLVTSLFY